MSSNTRHNALRRLALALAAAGLLVASLSIADRSSGGNAAVAATAGGPTFDPLPTPARVRCAARSPGRR